MSLTFLKALLLGTTLAALLAIAGLAVWVFWSEPLEIPAQPRATFPMLDSSAIGSSGSKRSFDGLADLALLGAVKNQSSEGVVPETFVPVDPVFAIELVGTWVDGQSKFGLFRDQRGSYDRKTKGQMLALSPSGVEVESVEPGEATLRHSGKLIRIAIPEPYRKLASQPVAGNGEFEATTETGPRLNTTPPPPVPMWPGSVSNSKPASGEEGIFDPLPEHMNPTGDPNHYGQPGASGEMSPAGSMGSAP